jgi:hypothetical protein
MCVGLLSMAGQKIGGTHKHAENDDAGDDACK